MGAIVQSELDRIEQQAPSNTFKNEDPTNFQYQVLIIQLEKLLATGTLKFDIGDSIFAEQFFKMTNLRRPIIGLHFMRQNSVIIETTHCFVQFPN